MGPLTAEEAGRINGDSLPYWAGGKQAVSPVNMTPPSQRPPPLPSAKDRSSERLPYAEGFFPKTGLTAVRLPPKIE